MSDQAMDDALLRLDGVNARYGTGQSLFGVSLAVPRGEIVALLGRNGAGKSTTLRSIMRIGVRTEGGIWYDGRDLTRLGTTAVARLGIGYVPEDRRIFGRMTVRENLLLGRYLARGEREAISLDTALATFPTLEPLLGRRGGVLSGGEQQLLAVARSLVGNPQLMLLDEPSEGLAPLTLRQVRAAIESAHATYGVTVLLAEQNATFALALASRVVLIDTGRVVFTGATDELREQPALMSRYLGVESAGFADEGRPT